MAKAGKGQGVMQSTVPIKHGDECHDNRNWVAVFDHNGINATQLQ
jgi:hypothetical protein